MKKIENLFFIGHLFSFLFIHPFAYVCEISGLVVLRHF
jgi:hypothetical protein